MNVCKFIELPQELQNQIINNYYIRHNTYNWSKDEIRNYHIDTDEDYEYEYDDVTGEYTYSFA